MLFWRSGFFLKFRPSKLRHKDSGYSLSIRCQTKANPLNNRFERLGVGDCGSERKTCVRLRQQRALGDLGGHDPFGAPSLRRLTVFGHASTLVSAND